MKIVFLTRRFLPDLGGVEKHVLEISKCLIAEGHKVTVITQSTGPSDIEGIRVLRMPPFTEGKSQKFQIWQWLLRESSLFLSADVVHCHDVFFWYFPFRFLCPWIPVYTTFHGYETSFPPTNKSIRLRKLYEFLSWGNVCIGKYLEKWYGTKADIIVYGGITMEKLAKPIPSHKTLHISFIGRLEPDTGLDIYLQALDMLSEQKIAYTFDAYGDGTMRKEVESYGKAYGFVSDVQRHIADADIVFASSYQSVLDAFAQKKFVIAVTQNPLKQDYFATAPYAHTIVRANDAGDIVNAIKLHTKNPSSSQKDIESNYQFAVSHTWENITKKYHTLWQK